jgi:hypothetical protein
MKSIVVTVVASIGNGEKSSQQAMRKPDRDAACRDRGGSSLRSAHLLRRHEAPQHPAREQVLAVWRPLAVSSKGDMQQHCEWTAGGTQWQSRGRPGAGNGGVGGFAEEVHSSWTKSPQGFTGGCAERVSRTSMVCKVALRLPASRTAAACPRERAAARMYMFEAASGWMNRSS